MVVMEYIEGNTEESAWPGDAREKLESLRVVQKLHPAQFVFGDLQASNSLFVGDDPLLIDFDWVGKLNEVRYPRNLSSGREGRKS